VITEYVPQAAYSANFLQKLSGKIEKYSLFHKMGSYHN